MTANKLWSQTGIVRRAPRQGVSIVWRLPHKKTSQRHGFKTGESIVYPAHGVGQIVAIEEQEVAGMKLELFVIDFEKDKMRLKVPVAKAVSIGMRKLSETDFVERALKVVQGKARVKRTMWSRRAQEYDAKINSGDLISIAEVVRDLYRAENQPEQSYSERQLYEAALDRMAREIAAVNKMSDTEAVRLVEVNLNKGPKRGAKAEERRGRRPGRSRLIGWHLLTKIRNPAFRPGFFVLVVRDLQRQRSARAIDGPVQ